MAPQTLGFRADPAAAGADQPGQRNIPGYPLLRTVGIFAGTSAVCTRLQGKHAELPDRRFLDRYLAAAAAEPGGFRRLDPVTVRIHVQTGDCAGSQHRFVVTASGGLGAAKFGCAVLCFLPARTDGPSPAASVSLGLCRPDSDRSGCAGLKLAAI